MLAEGLLWFDDDPRRPLQVKIADAITRYSERTGWQPTVCETHPALVEMLNAEMARASTAKRPPKASATPIPPLPPRLRVLPNAALRPNYFLIGIAEGERPRKAVSQPTSATRRRSPRPVAATAATAATTSEPTLARTRTRASKPGVKVG